MSSSGSSSSGSSGSSGSSSGSSGSSGSNSSGSSVCSRRNKSGGRNMRRPAFTTLDFILASFGWNTDLPTEFWVFSFASIPSIKRIP